jgi:uncharacterized membrane protein
MFDYLSFIEYCINFVGVFVITVGILIATISFVTTWANTQDIKIPFKLFRQNLSRVILLGLEFLIAGDIIHSVAEVPTLESVAILFCIIIIRLILSWELQMEIEGRWPWQNAPQRNRKQQD